MAPLVRPSVVRGFITAVRSGGRRKEKKEEEKDDDDILLNLNEF